MKHRLGVAAESDHFPEIPRVPARAVARGRGGPKFRGIQKYKRGTLVIIV